MPRQGQPNTRERQLWPGTSAALLVSEVQNYIGHRAGAIYRNYTSQELQVVAEVLAPSMLRAVFLCQKTGLGMQGQDGC